VTLCVNIAQELINTKLDCLMEYLAMTEDSQ